MESTDDKKGYRFDIQYIISVTLLVFALHSAGFTPNVETYYAFFIASAVLMILVILLNTYDNFLNFESEYEQKVRKVKSLSFLAFSLIFIYLVSQSITLEFTSCKFIIWGLPLVPVIVVGVPLFEHLISLVSLNKLEVKVMPETLIVFKEESEEESIELSVKNGTSKAQSVILKISFPNEEAPPISIREQNNQNSSQFFEKTLNLEPGKSAILFFFLKHASTKSVWETCSVVAKHASGILLDRHLKLYLQI